MPPLRTAVVVAAAVILQVSLFARFSFEGARPDVVVLVAIVVGFVAGPRQGAIAGFAAGLAFDLFLATPLGLSALVYTLVGYGVGSLTTGLLRNRWWIGPAFVAVSSAAAVLLYALLGTIFGQASFQGPPLSAIIVIVTALNTILSPLALATARWASFEGRHVARHRAYLVR